MLKGVRIVAMPIRQLLAQMVSIYMQVILEMTKSMLFVTTQVSLNHLEADKSRDVSFKHGSGPRHMVFSPNGKQAPLPRKCEVKL